MNLIDQLNPELKEHFNKLVAAGTFELREDGNYYAFSVEDPFVAQPVSELSLVVDTVYNYAAMQYREHYLSK